MNPNVRLHVGILATGIAGYSVGAPMIGESVKVYLGGVLTATATEPARSVQFSYRLKDTLVASAPAAIPVPLTETVAPIVTAPAITETVSVNVIGIYMPLPPETVDVDAVFAGLTDTVTMDLQTTILIPLSETVAPDPTEPTITETITPTLHL